MQRDDVQNDLIDIDVVHIQWLITRIQQIIDNYKTCKGIKNKYKRQCAELQRLTKSAQLRLDQNSLTPKDRNALFNKLANSIGALFNEHYQTSKKRNIEMSPNKSHFLRMLVMTISDLGFRYRFQHRYLDAGNSFSVDGIGFTPDVKNTARGYGLVTPPPIHISHPTSPMLFQEGGAAAGHASEYMSIDEIDRRNRGRAPSYGELTLIPDDHVYQTVTDALKTGDSDRYESPSSALEGGRKGSKK